MNESIDILSSDNSTIEEQLNAVTCLQQYKLDIEKIMNGLDDNKMDETITITNINTVMSDIKKKMDKIDFENLGDIVKLHTLKSQIMTCNYILNNNRPNIKLIDNGNITDITDKIKDKFVIADFLNIDLCQVHGLLPFSLLNSNIKNITKLNKEKIFNCIVNLKCDIEDILTIDLDNILTDIKLIKLKKMIVPDFKFKITYEIKILKKYNILKYNDDNMYFNLCLGKDNKLIYSFIEQINNYFYLYIYDMNLYILSNDYNVSIPLIKFDKIIDYDNKSINEIIQEIYIFVGTIVTNL